MRPEQQRPVPPLTWREIASAIGSLALGLGAAIIFAVLLGLTVAW
jgi:hypothetical protein